MSFSTFEESVLYGGYWVRKSRGAFQDFEFAGGNLTLRKKKKVNRVLIHREEIDNHALISSIN
jgi:hypothetical protein